MKLKTKLLPLAGIAVAAASITPFVASCGSKKYVGNWEWTADQGYTQKSKMHDAQELDYSTETDRESACLKANDKIINQWVDDIKEDYNVFYDDFAYTRLNPYAEHKYREFAEFTQNFTPIQMSMQLNDINVIRGVVSASEWMGEADQAQISLSAHFEGIVWAEIEEVEYSQYTKMDFELINIPLALTPEMYFEEGDMVSFQIAKYSPEQEAYQDVDWSVKVTIEQNGLITQSIYDEKYHQSLIFPILAPDGDENILVEYVLPTFFDIPYSYHFSLTELTLPSD